VGRYLPAYEDGTDRVFRNVGIQNQTPGHYPEESIQHSEHSESLKSRIIYCCWVMCFNASSSSLKFWCIDVHQH